MKKVCTLALSLFAAATLFAQTAITYDCNALRAGDVRNLKQIDYQAPGAGGTGLVWDFSQSKELKSMTISQAQNRAVTSNNNLNLICDEGGVKNTIFEISKTQKRYWGLENASVKINFNEPIVDLKFPFYYGEKIEGIMDGTYTDILNNKVNPIKGTYTTQADALGTVKLPDGSVFDNVLRVRVEKKYTQTFQSMNGTDEEYQIISIRYQYFAKGVRYPILIILETEVKTDCKCSCSNKTKEAYCQAPLLEDLSKEVIGDKGNAILNDFQYSVSPNPFKDDLRVAFSLSQNAKIEIELVEMSGKVVKRILNENIKKGDHVYNVNAADVIEGNYIITLKVDGEIYSNKLVKK